MIKISKSVLIFGLLAIFTGYFKNFLIIYGIIIIHEASHALCAYFLGEKIEFLKIHAYGGNLLTETHINKPLRKEFFIIIAGPLSHLIIYLLNYLLLRECLILMHTYNLIKSYNTVILLFNLLPIWPLDGGKLLFLLINKFFPFKKSHLMIIKFSLINLFLIYLWYKRFTLNILIIIIFLIFSILKEYKNHNFLFNRFLLERYLNNYDFKRFKIIFDKNLKRSTNKYFRDYYHITKIDENIYLEKEVLKSVFETNKN